MGRGIRGQHGGRRLPAGAEAERGCGRLAPPRRRPGGIAGRWVRGLAAGGAAAGSRRPRLPPRDSRGRTVWVTRARPKIDRIACPWLIRRFVDPAAVFLFVAPPRSRPSRSASTRRRSTSRTCSGAIAARPARSTPWSRNWDSAPSRCCTWRPIVRGADTARLDLGAGSAGASRRLAGTVAHVRRRSGPARGRHGCSTTRSIAGAATPRRKGTTGRPRRRRI